ncbi:MAG TPA: TIGR04282 family arsenosugar biosynthesis glycosyltransferase [Pyrinomonadaceae bacterium]|nr:TIGR04282 family arsenosugar biosynthesis glycosyltransferase [Pyrinomonadaceae bacterium]
MIRPAVVLMIKAPLAGLVKTRLSPPLSAAEAASLAGCFARDAVGCAGGAGGEVVIAYAPAGGRATLGPLLPSASRWVEQKGGDLGARLEAVAVEVFGAGFGPVVILGADSPTLPPAYVARAVSALAAGEADIALGPTEDGGYYLVALRAPAPGIFQNIEWSTPRAYAQTARNAAARGLRLLELPDWYDVDTPEDLARLRAELLADEEARRRAPATYEWVKRNHFLTGA